MRVLITGGAGFLGHWLQVGLAEEKHVVCAPSSAELDVRDIDLCRIWMGQAEPDWVFHLAAKTKREQIAEMPSVCMDVAGEGTRNILQAVSEAGKACRVVVASSCHVYGLPQSIPVPEEHPLQPQSTYGLSKQSLEACVGQFAELDVVVARLFHLVGPGQPPAFAVSSWARQSRQTTGPVTVGALDLERDYLDVRDGAAAMVALAHRGEKHQAYNVCQGVGVTLRWMFEQVTGGREAQVDPGRLRTDDPLRLIGDPSKIRSLNWRPQVSLQTSLDDLVDGLEA